MAIKDLAVAFNGSDNSLVAVRFAIQMCRKYGAALTGLHVHAPVEFTGSAAHWVPKDVLESLRAAQAEAAAGIEAMFREAVAGQQFDGAVSFVAEEGQPIEVLARTARYYDLMLIGQYSNPDANKRHMSAENLVTRAGKPIVVVPNGYEVRPFNGEAVVAWDGSRPAARALSDAMQILETKTSLDVVTVVAEEGAPPSPPPQRDVMRYLASHGINARSNVIPASRDGIAATIVDFCARADADVLVMGAFGHARLREDLFGGVTRDILRTTRVPVLLAH